MAALTAISAIAGLAGSFIQARGTIAAGKAAQVNANYEAQQLDLKAKEEQAAAQRDAEEEGRRKDLALSKLQSNAAASGFSATDPTALQLADEISRYGTYQQQLTEYGGQSRRTGLEAQAEGKRLEGAAARKGASYAAAGTILGGISSLASKYNPATTKTSAPAYYYG
jgi:hypothetical protein